MWYAEKSRTRTKGDWYDVGYLVFDGEPWKQKFVPVFEFEGYVTMIYEIRKLNGER